MLRPLSTLTQVLDLSTETDLLFALLSHFLWNSSAAKLVVTSHLLSIERLLLSCQHSDGRERGCSILIQLDVLFYLMAYMRPLRGQSIYQSKRRAIEILDYRPALVLHAALPTRRVHGERKAPSVCNPIEYAVQHLPMHGKERLLWIHADNPPPGLSHSIP